MSAINSVNMNMPVQNNNPVLGITAPNIHSNYQDIMDTYNEIQDFKNNSIAVTIANHRKNKERIGATAIGFVCGALQGGLFASGYALAKSFPVVQKLPGIKWVVGKVDEWVIKAKNLHPEKGRFYHLSAGIGMKVLYSAITSAALGFAFDLYKTYSETRINGKISNTRQGMLKDDYLLSGLNSLSYSKIGKKAIKDAVHKDKDGNIVIKFKGINKEYTVTKQELKKASKKYVPDFDEKGKVRGYDKKYSTGDGDVLAFELAFEKYRTDLKEGKIEKDKNIPAYAYEYSKNDNNPIDLGTPNQLYYLLTGKKCAQIDFNATKNYGVAKDLDIFKMYSKKHFDKFMKDFSKTPENYAAGCNLKIKEQMPFRNKHHQKIKLMPEHEYAIKKINDKYVTIVDPQKSRIPIEVPVDMFKSIVGSVYYFNNNDNEEEKPLQALADMSSLKDRCMND